MLIFISSSFQIFFNYIIIIQLLKGYTSLLLSKKPRIDLLYLQILFLNENRRYYNEGYCI